MTVSLLIQFVVGAANLAPSCFGHLVDAIDQREVKLSALRLLLYAEQLPKAPDEDDLRN